jgi:hypothetical protein
VTKAELVAKLMLLPPHIEADFATEEGVIEVSDAELKNFTALCTLNRYQGTDLGERPRLLVLLPRGVRSIAAVDKQLQAAFEEIRLMKATLANETAH